MSFAALHKFVTFLLAGLGLAALFLGGELTPPVQALVAVGFVLALFAEGPRVASDAWQRNSTIALVLLFALEVTRGVLGAPLLSLGLEFTAALQLSRLANRRSAAEHQQIAILAFLHLCAATVLSTEIAYGFAFLGFVVVVPWMLALTHLRSAIEAHHAPDPGADPAALARMLASRRLVGASFLAGTAALSIPLFLMTGGLFVLFPRVGFGMLSFGRAPSEHVAGFGGDVSLGDVGRVRDDPRVLMRVTPPGLDGTPPSSVSMRMRGTSFDHYDGRRWTRTRNGQVAVPRDDEAYLVERPPTPRDARWEIVLEHIDETVVFLPENTVAIDVPPRVESGFEVRRRLLRAAGLELRYQDEDGLGLRYSAFVRGESEPPRAPLAPSERSMYLQLPEGVERVAAWAASEAGDAPTPEARAARLVERLRRFDYSLEMRDPGDRAPLDAFLFDWRAGHCEYFATALAIGLRTLGIPARNVTGFLGGRWNGYGRYYAIAHGDAHSWVEAWFDSTGWVTLEPTPSSRSEIGFARGLFDDVRALFDALRARWSNDVVGYDLRSQRSLARRLLRWLASMRAPATPAPRAPVTSPSTAPRLPPAVLGVALVLTLLVVAVIAWRRRRPEGEGPAPLPRATREIIAIYRDLERGLAARGVPRPTARTPREHAAWLAAQGFDDAARVRALTERYLEVRFGGATIDDAELAALRASARAIGSARENAR